MKTEKQKPKKADRKAQLAALIGQECVAVMDLGDKIIETKFLITQETAEWHLDNPDPPPLTLNIVLNVEC